MIKKLTALLVGAMLMMATSAMATPISGNISFNGELTLMGPEAEVTFANATGIDFSSNYLGLFDGFSGLVGGSRSGDYANVSRGTGVVFSDFTFSPNLIPSTVVGLWHFISGGKEYSFDLLSVTPTYGQNTLTLNGTGLLRITDFDATLGTWTLTTQGSGGELSFSAASSVPEPGTMVLLGAGLLGLAIFGKRRMGRA